jgi:UDP-glucuronate decarboxylase
MRYTEKDLERKMNNEEIEEIISNLRDISKSIEDRYVLVTGGAGFVDSWLCDVLVEQNAKVICLHNLVSGLKFNISHLMARAIFKFVQHDVTQPIFFDEQIEVMMHLASGASPFEFITKKKKL